MKLLTRILVLKLFEIELYRAITVNLSIFNRIEDYNTQEAFPKIEDAFKFILSSPYKEDKFYQIALKPGISHNITESWTFDYQVNISIIVGSECPEGSECLAEVHFIKTDSQICLNGTWTFCDILFKFPNKNDASTPYLMAVENSSLAINRGCFFDNKTVQEFRTAIIYAQQYSKIILLNTTIRPYSFSGIFLAGAGKITIKSLKILSSLLANGTLFLLRGGGPEALLSDVMFESCIFIFFNAFDICVEHLEFSSLVVKNCEFSKESALITSTGEDKYPIESFVIKQLVFNTNKVLRSDIVVLSKNLAPIILISELFIETNTFFEGGLVLLQNSYPTGRSGKIDVMNLHFTSSSYLYGIKILSPKSVLQLKNLTFLKNNLNEQNMGLSIQLSSLYILNISFLKFIENRSGFNAVGAFLTDIAHSITIDQCIFYSNLADSNDTIGCALVVFGDLEIKLDISDSLFEKNFIDSLSQFAGASVLNIQAPNANLTITSSKFIENKAVIKGNAIEFLGNSLKISDSVFAKNQNLYFNGTISNLPRASTGIMTLECKFFFLINGTLDSNIGYLGNVYFKNPLLLVIENINFISNSANLGDFLHIGEADRYLNVSINFCSFSNNTNELYGLLFYAATRFPIDLFIIWIKDSNFQNESIYDEGYFFLDLFRGKALVFIEQCIFNNIKTGIVNNKLTLSGSIIYIQGWLADNFIMHLNNCYINRTESLGPVGFMMFIIGARVEIKNTSFQSNTHFSFFILDVLSKLLIDACNIIDSTGWYTALFLVRSSQIMVMNSSLYWLYSYYTLIDMQNDAVMNFNNITLINAFVLSNEYGALFFLESNEEMSLISRTIFINVPSVVLSIDTSKITFSDNIINATYSSICLITRSQNFVVNNLTVYFAYCESTKFSKAGLIQSSESKITISNLFIRSFYLEGYCGLGIFRDGSLQFNFSFIQNIISNNIDKVMIVASNMYSFVISNVTINYITFGILLALSSNVTINSLVINKGYIFKTSAVLFKDSWFEMENSLCMSLTSINSIEGCCLGVIKTEKYENNYLLSRIANCSFIENSVENGNGGAIFLSTDSANLTRNIFDKNSATFGGAIYIYNIGPIRNNKNFIYFEGNKFNYNDAKKAGGAVFWDIIKPENLDSNLFISNTANLYGENIASPTIRMILEIEGLESLPDSELKLNNLRPGFYSNITVYLKIADAYFQTMRLDALAYSEMIILSDNAGGSFALTGRLVGDLFSETNSSRFNKFAIEAEKTGFLIFLTFTSNLLVKIDENIFKNITKLHENENFSNGTYRVILPVWINGCEVGEILTKGDKVCRSCPKGSYSFDAKDSICKVCLRGAICWGGKNTTLKPGFWRSHPFSEKIYACNRALSSCKGGYDDLCVEDYFGMKCEKCSIVNKEGDIHQRSFSGNCLQCLELAILTCLLAAIIIFLALLSLLLTFIFLNSRIPLSVKIAIKSFIAYLQYCLITQSYDSSIPIYFRDYLLYSRFFVQASSVWFLIECLIKNITQHYAPHLEAFTVGLACFLVGLISYFFFRFFQYILKRRQFSFSIAHTELKHYLIVTFYVFGPSLSDYLISYMICQEIEGGRYLKKDPEYSCLETNHLLWIGLYYVPALFLVSFVPIYCFYSLIRQRKKINIIFCEKAIENKKKYVPINVPLTIYEIGYFQNNVILQETYIYLHKILLVSLNQSTIEGNIKYPLLLFVMIASFITLDPIILSHRYNLFFLLDISSKFSVISIAYLILWISDDETASNSIDPQVKVSSQAVFTIMVSLQVMNCLFHLAIAFRSYFSKLRIAVRRKMKAKIRKKYK